MHTFELFISLDTSNLFAKRVCLIACASSILRSHKINKGSSSTQDTKAYLLRFFNMLFNMPGLVFFGMLLFNLLLRNLRVPDTSTSFRRRTPTRPTSPTFATTPTGPG